jgi:hypothetical protein
MRVHIEGEPDIRMPRQRLRHLGRDPGLRQPGNEEVPQRVEVRVAAVVVAVGEVVSPLAVV